MAKPRTIKAACGQVIVSTVFDETGDLIDMGVHSSMEKAMRWAEAKDMDDGSLVNFVPYLVDNPEFGDMLHRLQ